ncbi:MAG: tRNA uridine-5-carboxymethylaminomethyl(34) synthesis enzyme MnmG [Candidatus Krumholzibacteriota bacterium]|nr:tRNA uridine-5-carboxymethylaminomethyl(34) synthesis enzyme MnmG [Candidatus Krumholzibacteriota bacterium]
MLKKDKKAPGFSVIVIGGGHAGCEAALASARIGFDTALITISRADIARMPCNPAIGGLAKGQLVREVDALGGEMGLCIDEAGIQFRMLNRAKGPAVWSPRAQADKKVYHRRMLKALREEKNLTLIEGEATAVAVRNGKVEGVAIAGGEGIGGKKVILALGTFPNGIMHIGEKQIPGGREGEPPSCLLSDQLAGLGIERRRLKTGTPPRLEKSTLDYSRCQIQPGDDDPVPFSFRTRRLQPDQVPCYITWTNGRTHEIIAANIDRAPLFTGQIKGTGPRYCPSIEDKVVRFRSRERHQLFLEPESRESEEIYVNGLATSLPADVQERILRTIPGLEEARIVRYGYAIEYDFFPPHQIHRSLESRKIEGLYFAGQVNGTSGYEEAAAQGIVAGINACLSIRKEPPIFLDRHQAYIGVLLDDLVTKEIDEPYRMFTSRAEHRLLLRQDNADERLMKYAVRYRLLGKELWEEMICRRRRVERARRRLAAETVPADRCKGILKEILPEKGAQPRLATKLLQIPGVDLEEVESVLKDGPLGLGEREREMLRIRIKYEGYIRRQKKMADKMLRMDKIKIPSDFSFEIEALSAEAREKLQIFKPENLGQASRISGVRASDLSILMIFLERRNKQEQG